jgi:hypothetical protein
MDHATAVQTADFAEFLAGYVAALLWSSTDTANGEDVNLDDFSLSTAGADKCRADCLAFFVENHADLTQAAEVDGYSWGNAGHDFALTRNGHGHGAGFWDGDLPEELGERLTEASETSGAVELYLGDDQLIYIC